MNRQAAPTALVPLRFVDYAVLALALLLGFSLRTLPAHDQVFRGDQVIFAGNDAWIHMRNVDGAAAHLLHPSWFDPYRLAPDGQWAEAPLMDHLIAGIATLLSGGRPSQQTLDATGAWFPPVAGALVAVPLFFLTRRLFGREAALLAALLIAILPGQLFQRSLLGGTDHHVVEALLCVTTLLFLVRAVDAERPQRDIVAAGIFLGLYLLSWSGGAFFVLILLVAAGADLLASILRQEAIAPVTHAIAGALLVAALIAFPALRHLPVMSMDLPLLVGGGGGFLALAMGVRGMQRAGVAPVRIVGSVILGALVLLAAALAFIPHFDERLMGQMSRFAPSAGAQTVGEVHALLTLNGRLSLLPLWAELTTSAVLAVIGLLLLAAALRRERAPAKLLFLVWSVVVIAATLAQVRFGYYLAMAAAILSAHAAVRLLDRRFNPTFAVLAVVAIVLYPNLPRAVAVAEAPNLAPGRGWLDALGWMRMHTPEPFANAEVYRNAYDTPTAAPRPSYSVMVWWDYGYWVSRIARRVPVANPTQEGAYVAARFYTATDERSAVRTLESCNARYVIADDSMVMRAETAGLPQASELEPMTRWANVDPDRFFQLFYQRDATGRLLPLFLYYPDYYRTMAMRLYALGGAAWTPDQSTWLVAWRAVVQNGRTLREITASRRFDRFEEAQRVQAAEPGRWILVGRDPLRSPVPIPPLSRFRQEARTSGVAIFGLR